MKSHITRVGSLAWNHHILTSGSRSGIIHHHDVRVADHHVGTLKIHEQEVCGLKWSHDGRYLASGANDNQGCYYYYYYYKNIYFIYIFIYLLIISFYLGFKYVT